MSQGHKSFKNGIPELDPINEMFDCLVLKLHCTQCCCTCVTRPSGRPLRSNFLTQKQMRLRSNKPPRNIKTSEMQAVTAAISDMERKMKDNPFTGLLPSILTVLNPESLSSASCFPATHE